MQRIPGFIILALLLFSLGACHPGKEANNGSAEADSVLTQAIMKEHFGRIGKKEVFLYTLVNKNGITVKITNYGAIITTILVPDKNGKMGDIVLGYDSLKDYIAGSPYFGAIVGRYANRIAKGKFTLNGKGYTLAVNNGKNSLHGGLKGFDKVVWDAAEKSDTTSVSLVLTYLSPDGEEGYPGNLKVQVTYTLGNDNVLTLVAEAETDKTTPAIC